MNTSATTFLSESLEDYLEAIFRILTEKAAVRPKDIAQMLNVTNASVTGALRALAGKELIHYAPYDLVTLTPLGRETAERIYRRHTLMKEFLTDFLRVSPAEAEENACRLEHALSEDVIQRFVRLTAFLKDCPRAGSAWIAGFEHQCDQDAACEHCEKCVFQVLERVQEKRKGFQGKAFTEIPLASLPQGRKGRMTRLELVGETEKKFAQMGVSRGTVVEVERSDASGAPIEIRVKGFCLLLSAKDAEGIFVTPMEEKSCR
ncbi:MAG: metal-dependent transcriptional regulator [Planctomycetia bacterium]|nr:metal-dependent transcriptional regulator [Planctomycetia bacterium]